jgi:cell pole-organizing protein PopZ
MGEINQDPSMEEILASIKRVIAEDGRTTPGASRSARARRSEFDPDDPEADPDDILELDDPLAEEETLLSENSAAASRQSLAALTGMRDSGEVSRVVGEGPLEAAVREMLRPMLKQWLDQRLPEMVEEMVSREIARITGKQL